jgi:cupin fold WbuC family metalloprotein
MEIDGFRRISAAVFQTPADPLVVYDDQINQLVVAAKQAPAGRARLLLHPDQTDSLHEMLIALPPSSCDVPHINFKSGKSFLALSGQFAIVHFSNDGREAEAVVLSGGAWPGSRVMRLRRPVWHTVIPLEGDTVFLETIIGPFDGNRFAPWFPDQSLHEERTAFINKLRDLARSKAASMAANKCS